MAGQRRAGDLDQGTREGGWADTGEAGTEVGGAEGSGFLKTDTVDQTSEDAERTGESVISRTLPPPPQQVSHILPLSGSEGGGPAGPEPEATMRTTQARRRASTRTWAGAGTTEEDTGRIEGGVHREVRHVCSDPPTSLTSLTQT